MVNSQIILSKCNSLKDTQQQFDLKIYIFRLVLKHIPLNEGEHRMQRYREKQLEPPCEEEEIEEVEVVVETEQPIESEKADESQTIVDLEKKIDEKIKTDGNESDHSRSSRSRSRSKSRSASSN